MIPYTRLARPRYIGEAMHDKPASAPDVMPPHELPKPEDDPIPEGSNVTIHHPDPDADRHRVIPEHRKERGPYTTGND